MKRTKFLAIILTITIFVTQFMSLSNINVLAEDLSAHETVSTVGTKISVQPSMTNTTFTFGGKNADNSNCTNFTGIARQNILFTPVYLTGAEYVEFDIYISNYDSFRSAMTNASAQFRVMFTTRPAGTWDRRKGYNITDMITADGWNHIVLRCADYSAGDASLPLNAGSSDTATTVSLTNTAQHVFFEGGLQRVYFAYYAPNTSAANPIASDTFTVSNIIATKKVTPASNTQAPVINTLSASGKTFAIGARYDYMGTNSTVTSLTKTDFSKADFVEFDIFVPSYEVLKADMDSKGVTNMAIRLSSNQSVVDSNQATATFFNSKVTKSGWNHIVIAKTDFNTNSVDWSNIQSFKIYANGTTTVASTQSAQQLTVANIEATGLIRCGIQNENNFSDAFLLDGITSISMGADFSTQIMRSGFLPVDISEYEAIELDVYVQDCTALKAAIVKHNSDRSLCLRISSTTGSDISVDSLTAQGVSNQFVKNGWNHIYIPKSDLKKGSTNGNIDLTSIKNYIFYFNGTKTDANDAYKQNFAVANITATRNLTSPNVYPTDKTDVFEGELQFEDSDNLSQLPSTVDISSRNMLEFNIYNKYSSAQNVTISLNDNALNTASFTVTCNTKGWNHFCVRIDDFSGINSLDKNNINSVVLSGNSGYNYYISSIYATDYQNGDANRDNTVDIIDLVVADGYYDNPANYYGRSSFNICAADLVGNDYQISDSDITEIAALILNN